ncbi:Protein phosphatase Slingshot [Eumeta japonica]|uniref:Protein phosphatase Slingshot n=1 Tax=Eumeta variegata TaxID=151549 RepID=A0A4C1WCD6_EUMVA|nr:Protein phosphatase Slingshot [Eumeta japonica]
MYAQAVKLESAHAGRTRYLVVVCRRDEAVLLGIDCNERTTVGLVLRVLADTAINLDGDGAGAPRAGPTGRAPFRRVLAPIATHSQPYGISLGFSRELWFLDH